MNKGRLRDSIFLQKSLKSRKAVKLVVPSWAFFFSKIDLIKFKINFISNLLHVIYVYKASELKTVSDLF